MNLTKIRTLLYGSALLLLQSCGWQLNTPTISEENVENVNLVAYLSDGDFDWKNVGEVILIESGEHLQVRRNQIRPDPQFITRRWDDNFFLELEKSSPVGKVPLKLDRKNGVVCNATHCTTLYSICPSWSEMGQGKKKCVSFPRE